MTCEPGQHCITCSDEGTPMRVVRLDPGRGLALCEAEPGRRSTVETALLPEVTVGEVLLVHAGVALARLDEDAAPAAAPQEARA